MRGAARGHVACVVLPVPEGRTLHRRRQVHLQTDQLAVRRHLAGANDRLSAEELRLVQLHRPLVVDPARRRIEVRVLTDDDVPLLQPKLKQDIHPVRMDAHILAELKQRPPKVDRIARRVVELVRQLAGEAQAQDPAGHACHFADTVSREPGQLLHAGLLQQLRGPRTGHVDGAQRLGLVQQVDVEARDSAQSRIHISPNVDPALVSVR